VWGFVLPRFLYTMAHAPWFQDPSLGSCSLDSVNRWAGQGRSVPLGQLVGWSLRFSQRNDMSSSCQFDAGNAYSRLN
jgi:hypothetical protein